MALIGHSDRGHGFQKLVLLLIVSLTILYVGVRLLLEQRIFPASFVECSLLHCSWSLAPQVQLLTCLAAFSVCAPPLPASCLPLPLPPSLFPSYHTTFLYVFFHSGNALEFCRIQPDTVECSDRTKSLVGIGAVSALIVLVVLVAKAAGLAAAGAIELLGSLLTLGLWVAAAALVTSAKTAAVVGGGGAAFWGSPAFFASWGGALVALSLTLRAVCDSHMVENMGLKTRRSAAARTAEAEPSEKALDVSNSDEAAAEYA